MMGVHPKSVVADWANDWGRKMGIFGVSVEKIPAGQHDDLDAFRHAFCHAYVMGWLSLTSVNKDISDWIGLIMEIPELFGPESTTSCASYMDLHNNLVGQSLAPTKEEMWSILRYAEDPTAFMAQRIADAVKREVTINSFADYRMSKKCHGQAIKSKIGQYIWHTAHDEKVRPEHAARDGKVFDFAKPPPGGNPGADYNCRCWAEPIPETSLKGIFKK